MKSAVLCGFSGKTAKILKIIIMSHNIDQQTIQIEAMINQLLSELPKTYVPSTNVDILNNNNHISFGQRLEAVCNQDYSLKKLLGWLVNLAGNGLRMRFWESFPTS